MEKNIESTLEESELRSFGFNDRIDLLRSRVELLRGKDKVLMKMYLQQSNTFRQMALLAGVNEATIARKIYKLTKRLIDSVYIMCLWNRSKFTELELDIARDYFIVGVGMKKIAVKRDCSYYYVRETLKKIQRLVQIEKEETNGGGDD